MKRDIELEATLVAKYAAVEPVLDERSRRRWAAAESLAIGYGGDAVVSSGHRSGSGDDSQGTPGDFPRRGADGPHSTPWRRTAPHPAGSTRHPGRAPSAGGSAHARRPDLAAALDVQESRKAGGGAERAGVAGEFDHCGPAAAPPGLPAAIAAQAAGRRHASGPQRAVRAHQPDRGRASDRRPAGDLGRHEEERAGRELQERRAGMAAEGHAAGGAGA